MDVTATDFVPSQPPTGNRRITLDSNVTLLDVLGDVFELDQESLEFYLSEHNYDLELTVFSLLSKLSESGVFSALTTRLECRGRASGRSPEWEGASCAK